MWYKYPEIAQELALVEDFIRKNVPSRNKLLSEITKDLVEAGGKRIRPAFAIISSKFGKYDREKAVSLAASLEILHTATLVHDDIIDRSKLRRGKETVAEKYGVDMAVYTGDFLFTKAVLMMSKNIPVDKMESIAKAIKSICEGEVDQFQDVFNINTSVLSYLKRINRKTAILFEAACGLGAMLSQCPDSVARNLAKFGSGYGMAFQIRDDLNDFLSDAAASGKPVGNDIVKGVITLPVIYALNRSDKVKRLVLDLFERKGQDASNDIQYLTSLIEKHGGMDYSRKMLESYIAKGIKALNRLPDNNYRDILNDMINDLKI